MAYPGYFIDVKEVKVNGEAVELGKGYTSSDNGIEMRSNLHNPWVDAAALPPDARRADGAAGDRHRERVDLPDLEQGRRRYAI